MNKSKVLIISLLLLTYLTFPLITNIPGVLLPFWTESFHLSSTMVSLLGSAFFLAYGLTSLPQGILLDAIGNKKTYVWAMSLIIAGSVLFALMPSFYTGLLSLFIIGSGITALQLVCNLLVKKLDDDAEKYSRNLTILQVFCGVGGASGGFLIAYLLGGLKLEWQAVYYIFGGLSLALAAMALFTNMPESIEKKSAEKPSLGQYASLLANPTMMLYALGIFIYVGIEVGVATWISTYLIGAFKISGLSAGKVVSAYWLSQTGGRMIGGFVLNYVPAPKALVAYSLACLASVIVGVTSPSLPVAIVGFAAAGFFTSIMFPCIFTMAVNSFDSKKEGIVAGVLNTAIVGGAVTAPVIGFISSATNLQTSLITAGTISFLYLAFLGLRASKKPAMAPVGVEELKGLKQDLGSQEEKQPETVI